MDFVASAKKFMFQDFSYKLVALLITLLIWLLVLGRGHETEDVNLKIEYTNIAKDLTVTESSYDVIKVKVKGPPKLIRKFILANSSIKLNQAINEEGVRRLRVYSKNLALPYGLRVLSINPREIRVSVKRKVGTK
jgi:hypothetical protein